MVLKKLTLNFLILILISCSSNSSVEKKTGEFDSETLAQNPKSLYVLHCESCHGNDGKKGLSNAADLSISKISDDQIKLTILNGNNKGMMPYKDLITNEKDVDNLVDYVKSLRK